MVSKTIYIAYDGKEFRNELDCVEYELESKLNEKGICLYDENKKLVLDATRAYEIVIPCDDDLTELWKELYDYCGFEDLPMGKGTWEWKYGREDRTFCEECSYHHRTTGGWTCQSGGQCYKGGWVRK